MDGDHYVETDLTLLGARHKVLLVARRHDDFSAVILDQSEYEALVAGRPMFTGKTLNQATTAARSAVELGKGVNRPWPGDDAAHPAGG